MPAPLDRLLSELDRLLADLDTTEVEHAEVIDAVADVHRRGAVNLVHCSELRRHDRRELQNDLMDLGVTSLATSEADVRAKVIAARNVLCALRGDAGPWPLQAINEALDEGDRILATNADAIFGALALSEAAHVPAIWATQVLENLAKTGQPTRAEITDAAISQRAECVMLNKARTSSTPSSPSTAFSTGWTCRRPRAGR